MTQRSSSVASCLGITYVYLLGWTLLACVGPLVLLGWTPTTLVSGSMEPRLGVGDVVLMKPYDGGALKPGQVVTFSDPAHPGETITHRIVGPHERGGYRTKGDSNAEADSTPVPRSAILGVGRALVPMAGTPVVWLARGAILLLLAWGAATVVAIVVATQPRAIALPTTWFIKAAEATASRRPHRARRTLDRMRWVPVPLVLSLLIAMPIVRTSGMFWDRTGVGGSFASATTFGAEYVKTIGAVSSCTMTQTTTVITVPAGGVAAGNTVIIRLMLREPPNGVVSVADAGSNAYSVDATVTGSRTRTVVASAHVVTPLTNGQTITITHPTAKAISAVATEFADIAATNRVDAVSTSSGNSTSPTATVTTSWHRTLSYGAVGGRDALTVTEAAGWTTNNHVSAACGANAAEDHGAYRTSLSAAAVTYAPTFSLSKEWSIALVAYRVVDNVRPDAPTLSGIPGDTEVHLSWTPVTDASGAVSYTVYRDGAEIYTGAATAFVDTGRTNGVTYQYTVRAADVNGNVSNSSNEVAVSPYTGASILFVKSLGTTTCGGTSSSLVVPAGGVASGSTLILTLVLREPPVGAVTATDARGNSYTVDADLHAGKARAVLLSTYVATALQAGDTITVTHPDARHESLAASQFSGIAPTSRVHVAATAGGDSNAPSVAVTTTTDRTLLVGLVGTENAPIYTEPTTATWTPLADAAASCPGGANGAQHAVYRTTATAGAKSYAPTMSSNVSWAAALVSYRPADVDTTGPAAPTLTVTAEQHKAVSLSWSQATDPSQPIVYRLFRDGVQVYSGTATSRTDTGLTNGNSYSYTVKAVDGAGNASSASASVTGTPTGDTTPPAAPTLSGTKGDGDNTLTWTAVTDPTAPITYRLQRGATVVYEGSALTFTDTVAGEATYTVHAVDGAENLSAASNAVTPSPGTVTAATVVKAEGGIGGAVHQGGGFYVYANATAGSTRVTADLTTITGNPTPAVLGAGTFQAGGVTYGYRSSLQTAANPLTAGSKAYSVTPSGGTAVAGTVMVDNTVPTGVDVQLVNKAGGTAGVPEQGDTAVFSFSKAIDPESIVAGWSGASTTVTVQILQNGSTDDTVTVHSADNTVLLPLGSVDTNGDPVSSTATFTGSTMVLTGTTITVTLGTINSGARTDGKTTPAVWTPSAAAFDAAGNPMSTAPVTETGTLDPSF